MKPIENKGQMRICRKELTISLIEAISYKMKDGGEAYHVRVNAAEALLKMPPNDRAIAAVISFLERGDYNKYVLQTIMESLVNSPYEPRNDSEKVWFSLSKIITNICLGEVILKLVEIVGVMGSGLVI